jgi:hypothetical protein
MTFAVVEEGKEAVMIELTEEQRQELSQPEPVAIDPVTKETYVLVRRDLYERIRHLFDDTALSKREVARLVDQAMREYDDGDPSLHLYQND